MTLDSLDAARVRSEQWIASMAAVIASDPIVHAVTTRGCGFVAVGSVGRREAVEGSDVDLILVASSGAVDVSTTELRTADRRARELIRDALGVKVSRGEDLTQPTLEADIACSDRIGGEHDTRALHTRRILLLTESVPIAGNAARESVRGAVFREYFSRSRSKGKHMLSLVNDIVRYYRTVMIDYKAKVDFEGKTWAGRNVKLRHSRKFWYFATALAFVAADNSAPEADDAERIVQGLLDLPPADRLREATRRAGPACDPGTVLARYDAFLSLYGDPERRERLEGLPHDGRRGDSAFEEFRTNSNGLHDAMLDCIDSLPAPWRRDLLSHFLL